MDNKTSYGADARETCELFADHLEGTPDRPFTVVSFAGPGDEARDAIEKSLATLGYGEGASNSAQGGVAACSYVTITARSSDITLDGPSLFSLIESLDPLGVICTDAQTTEMLSAAYREDFPLDSAVRVFGRSSITFADLNELIGKEAGKRKAWELFKSLRA